MKLLRLLRVVTFVTVVLLLLMKAVSAQEAMPLTPSDSIIPPLPPALVNADFECTDGYESVIDSTGNENFVPSGWRLTALMGTPVIHSARIFFADSCDGDAHVERINGIDSIVVRAEDLETPPNPGKSFDIAFHQQVSVTVGGAYSLSGWMLSLCGGSAVPSDCPQDTYIAKMLGIDPTGGTDPAAESVIWVENRRNFWEEGKRVGWQQMSVSAPAQAETITIFARVQSPQQWHGNHAFIDALSLVRAPFAQLTAPATVTGTVAALQWQGTMLAEITGQSGSSHELRFDLEYRHEDNAIWQPLATNQSLSDSLDFTATCTNTNYLFRIRARAEQPDEGEGAWPNHRYYGLWSEPMSIQFLRLATTLNSTIPATPNFEAPYQLYLPLLANQKRC